MRIDGAYLPLDLERLLRGSVPAQTSAAEAELWDQVGFTPGLEALMDRLDAEDPSEQLSLPTDTDLAAWAQVYRQQLTQSELHRPAGPSATRAEEPTLIFGMRPEELLALLIEYLMSMGPEQNQPSRSAGQLGGPSFSQGQPTSWGPSGARDHGHNHDHGGSHSHGAGGTHHHGRVTPPGDLASYGNGRIPRQALSPIGVGDHRLHAPAADAFKRMRADAAAAGVNIGVTDAYRSYEDQVDIARRKGLYSQGGLAAEPGTSNHGWGLSLDLQLDSRAQEWMRNNAGRYGFVEDVPREPWHWTFKG